MLHICISCGMLVSYLDQILEKHRYVDMPLHKVFTLAKIPTSTYYRTTSGKTELSLDTAKKVYRVLDRLSHAWPTALENPKKKNANLPKLSEANNSN